SPEWEALRTSPGTRPAELAGRHRQGRPRPVWGGAVLGSGADPRRCHPSGTASAIALIWKVAPSGSAIVATVPKGEGIGPSSTEPPSSSTRAIAAALESTPR